MEKYDQPGISEGEQPVLALAAMKYHLFFAGDIHGIA